MAKLQAPESAASLRAQPIASPAERSPVRAVQRAFNLLARLGGERGATLSELARETELPISTVARLLSTLEQIGFAQRQGDGRFGAGMKLIQIGLSALRGLNIYDLAEPHLRRLADASGETANLAVRADETHAIYLRQVLSRRAVRHSSWVGRMLPLDRTAVGAVLRNDLDASGFAVRRSTFEPDVIAIAAPVRGPDGEVAAALSITAPSYRIADSDLDRLGALVLEEATRVAAELGGAFLTGQMR
jgi:DNA-binding IclR family transcriptional regulator